jgi:hypothetical protein
MGEACGIVWSVLDSAFGARVSLEAEIVILLHQLDIQRRRQPERWPSVSRIADLGGLYCWCNLRLVIDIGRISVAKDIAQTRGSPSQRWKAFVRNHSDGIVAMDLFVVPTISFRLLYDLLIMGHGR